jgi:hypothetical protein
MSALSRSSQFWPAACVALLFAAAFAPQSFRFGATDWELVYVPAAERFLRGEDVFRDAFVYPPAAALLAIPSAHLGDFGVRVNVWLMNTVGATSITIGAWWLTGGRLSFRPPPRDWLIAVVGLAAYLGAVFEVMVNRQTDLLIGGLTVVGCWLVTRRRDWLGGAAVGLAAAVKCTPLLLAVYFLWVGRWRAGVAVLLAAGLANVLPDLIVPPPQGRPRAVEWAERFLGPMGRPEYRPGMWAAADWSNHSLAGVLNRQTAYRAEWIAGTFTPARRDDVPPTAVLKGVALGGTVVLLAVAAVATRRRFAAVEPFGLGMAFCLMLLLSPMSSKPHFCVLAVPAWAVAREGVGRRTWVLFTLAMLAGACELTAAKDLVGGRVNAVAMWYGAIPAGVLLLFAGCVWGRWTTTAPDRPTTL